MIKERKGGITTFLYVMIVFCYIFCHIDNGILAVSNESLGKDLGVSDSDVGLISAGVFLGNVAGSLLTPKLLTLMKPKTAIVAAAILNALAVGVFSVTKSFWIIFASRVLVGLFQVVFVIYFPVWIDLCSPPQYQTMWISFFFLAVPVGLVLGNAITLGLSTFTNYRWGFMVQSILMIVPISACFISIPDYYYTKE